MNTGNPNTDSYPVPIGVVGLGAFGLLHAATIHGLIETDLVAMVDPDEAVLGRAQRQWPSAGTWTDLSLAIEESDAKAWVIASSTASHVPLTRTILSAGQTVLLEKPIADSVAEAETLAQGVREDSSNLMMGHLLLFNSEFRQLKREMSQRGPIQFIDAVRHRPTATMDRFPTENPFGLTMVHDLYCVLALMDQQEPSQMTSQTHRTPDGRCDLALAQLQWPCGTIASLTASFMTPEGMASDGFDRMEVFGEGWSARVQANPRPMELWDHRARWPLALEIGDGDPVTGMLAEELRCFAHVVSGEASVPNGARYQDAVQIARMIDQLENHPRTH